MRLEAIRCIFGGVPGTRTGPQEEARNLKLRVRAWLLITSYVIPLAPAIHLLVFEQQVQRYSEQVRRM